MAWAYQEPPTQVDQLPEFISRTHQELETELRQPDWIDLVLENNWIAWTELSNGFPPTPQFRKNRDGMVFLRGLIQDGTASNGTILFTLPEGYRPLYRTIHVVQTGSPSARIRVDVYANGEVRILETSSTWVALDDISFLAEQ